MNGWMQSESAQAFTSLDTRSAVATCNQCGHKFAGQFGSIQATQWTTPIFLQYVGGQSTCNTAPIGMTTTP